MKIQKMFAWLGAGLLIAASQGCEVKVQEPAPKRGVEVKIDRPNNKGLDVDVDVKGPRNP